MRALAVAVALVVLSGCQRKDAIDKVVEEQRPANAAAAAPADDGDPVKLEVTAPKSDVALGDDIVFRFKLTNTGSSKVQVNVPRIDKRSVTFRVRREDGGVATIIRNHAEPDPRTGQLVYDAPQARELGQGESLVQDVSISAIEVGKTAFTASYTRQGAPSPVAGPTIDVTISAPDARKQRLGVMLSTSSGDYTAVLRPDVAYNTVESFASLVKKGFYDGVKLHRIIPGFMAQGGDPKGTGEGGPGYFLPLEAMKPPKLAHKRGVMSMARMNDPDTAGSQFFIMFAANPGLDAQGYTTFAEMVEGDDTLKKLAAVPRVLGADGDQSAPKTPVVIQKAELVTLP